MQDTIKGICTTCNSGPVCVNRKKHKQAVWYCEGFDSYIPLPDIPFASDSALLVEPAVSNLQGERLDYDLISGICINCDNRSTCDHAKSSPGIWQCNEYA